jgi:integrase
MSSTSTHIVPQTFSDSTWLNYFNPREAVGAVGAHIASLPSAQTEERHTEKVYSAGLHYFLSFAENELPTPNLITAFIGHLKRDRGLKSSTIGSKYLAPVRLYLRKLAAQQISVTGPERDYVQDCREHLRAALEMKTPRAETTSNIAALWREGKRLPIKQVNATLRQIDREQISGLRDYALLHTAFSTALRISELRRLTLSSISQEGEIWIITVRGKRNNVDPVPVSGQCVADIFAYAAAFNDGLPEADPRRIEADTPLWQPMIHGDNYPIIGVNRYTPQRGMSQQGLRNIIRHRTATALGADNGIAAHDTRRTAAAIAHDSGMSLPDIQALLRHKSAAVTLAYIGTKPDYKNRTLATYVSFG